MVVGRRPDALQPPVILVCIGLTLALLMAPTRSAADGERESLRGPAGVKVLAEVEGDLQRPELSPRALQGDVEAVLRQRGIPVLDEPQWAQMPGRPTLHVELNIAPGPSDTYLNVLAVELEQDVRLVREPQVTVATGTWSTPPRLGHFKPARAATVREALRSLVESFVTVYAETNRKR